MRTKIMLAVCAAMWIAPSIGNAVQVHGVRFEDRLTVEPGTSLDLCAADLLRYKRIFRGYVAALYLEDCALRADPLADVPRRLELSYFWSIPRAMFGKAAEGILERSVSAEELASLRERVDTLHAAYVDVEPDDRYALTYVPGRGTQLSLNGTELVTVPGADFARAYFGIWLGDRPLDTRLRDQLLRAPIPPSG